MSYSLNVERELPRGVFVELGYVGNQVRHLIRKPDINQPFLQALIDNPTLPSKNMLRPYKGYTAINMFRSDANSNYNSLRAYVSKRKGNLKFTSSYTYSKALTDAGPRSIRDSGSNDNIQEMFLRHLDYGPAGFDRTHVFVATYSSNFRFDSVSALVVSNTNITDGNYGKVTSAGPPRNVRFGLKLVF